MDTGVKVQVEEGAGIFDFEWEGEMLAPLEREYFDIIYIGEKAKTKAVCNIEYVRSLYSTDERVRGIYFENSGIIV